MDRIRAALARDPTGAYAWALAAAGAIALAIALLSWSGGGTLSFLVAIYADPERLAFFLLAFGAEALVIPLAAGRATTVTYAVVLCLLLRAGTAHAVLLVLPAAALAAYGIGGRQARHAAYVAALVLFPALAASLVYQALGANETWAYNLLRFFRASWLLEHPTGEGGQALAASYLTVLLATSVVYFAAQNSLNAVAVSLHARRLDLRRLLREAASEAPPFAAATAGGFAMAVAHANGGWPDLLLVAGALAGVIVLLRLYHRARATLAEREALVQVSRALSSSLDPAQTLDVTLDACRTLVRFDEGAVFRVRDDTSLQAVAARGADRAAADIVLSPGEGITGSVAQTARAEFVSDVRRDPRNVHVAGFLSGIRSGLFVPLAVDGKTAGVLVIGRREAPDLAAPHLSTIQLFVPHAEAALRNAKLYEKTLQMAITDPMTGVHNFRYFTERLRDEIRRHRRARRTLALAISDLDRFKDVNDRYGHLEGDRVIRAMADALRGALRQTDLLARYAGDEFVVVMPETSHAEARTVAERMRRAVEDHVAAGGERAVTVSVGFALHPRHGSDADSLVRAADGALYAAKRAGRNRIASARG